jgi:hypothetical protein
VGPTYQRVEEGERVPVRASGLLGCGRFFLLAESFPPALLTLFLFLFLLLFCFSFVIFAKQFQFDFKQLLSFANYFLWLFELQGNI